LGEYRGGPCDLNGDGLGDIVLATVDERGQLVAVFLGRSQVPVAWQSDLRTRPAVLLEGSTRPGFVVTCAGDLNGDGYSDLIGTTSSRVPLVLWRGGEELRASSWLELPERLPNATGASEAADVLTVGGDADGDGLSDVVAARFEGDVWFLRGSTTTGLAGVTRLRGPDGDSLHRAIAF